MSNTTTTPPPSLRVSALLSTFIHLPFHTVFQDCLDAHYPDSSGSYVPVLSFLIEHPDPNKGKVLFDLGVRKNAEGYPPAIPRVSQSRAAVSARKDVAELLLEGGINPKDITHIIYSHLHWDHTGDPSPFTNASIFIGGEARSILSPSEGSREGETWVYPTNPLGTVLQFPKSIPVRFIEFVREGVEPKEETEDRARVIAPFLTFERAIDFFGDGSLYVVDTPGHYPGHVSALVRVNVSARGTVGVSSGADVEGSEKEEEDEDPTTYVFLGGDICHNRQCYIPGGTRELSGKIQWDVARARESVARVRRLCADGVSAVGRGDEAMEGEVVVLLAHEAERLEEGMPLFPSDLGEWAIQRAWKQRAGRVSRSGGEC